MVNTPTQIADAVLIKLSADEWNTPQMLAAGGGLGAAAGLTRAGIQHSGDISGLLRMHNQRPILEASRESLETLLNQVRQQEPRFKDLSSRRLTKELFRHELSPEAYHIARKGYEEGIAGLSRNKQFANLFRKRLARAGILGGALGLGAGLGGGLLAAAGSGKFD
jgi:hypothetical protein